MATNKQVEIFLMLLFKTGMLLIQLVIQGSCNAYEHVDMTKSYIYYAKNGRKL